MVRGCEKFAHALALLFYLTLPGSWFADFLAGLCMKGEALAKVVRFGLLWRHQPRIFSNPQMVFVCNPSFAQKSRKRPKKCRVELILISIVAVTALILHDVESANEMCRVLQKGFSYVS